MSVLKCAHPLRSLVPSIFTAPAVAEKTSWLSVGKQWCNVSCDKILQRDWTALYCAVGHGLCTHFTYPFFVEMSCWDWIHKHVCCYVWCYCRPSALCTATLYFGKQTNKWLLVDFQHQLWTLKPVNLQHQSWTLKLGKFAAQTLNSEAFHFR